MGFSSYILLTLSIHVFHYKSRTTKYLQIESKVKLPILSLFSCLSGRCCKANAEWKHSPLQCIIASEHEKELEAHQTAALGKARENTSKHVRFYWHTFHHFWVRKQVKRRCICEGNREEFGWAWWHWEVKVGRSFKGLFIWGKLKL